MSDETPRMDAKVVLDTVTAFQDRAQLHYRTAAALELSPGTHVVVFRASDGEPGKKENSDRIWSEMDSGSLQVRLVTAAQLGAAGGTGDAAPATELLQRVMLRDVGQVTRTVEEAATEEVQQKKAALVEIRETLARLQREEKIMQGSKSYAEKLLARLTAAAQPGPAGETAAAHDAARAFLTNPAAWADMSSFVSGTTKRCERRVQELQQELRDVREKERRIEEELRGLREDPNTHLYYRSRTETTVEATVEVLPPRGAGEQAAARLGLVLSFIAPGVQWEPAYDVRVDRDQHTMEISYFAKVSQRTGVAWEDVCLRLSTAKPSTGASPPSDDGRWEITIQPPKPVPRPQPRFKRGGPIRLMACPAGAAMRVNAVAEEAVELDVVHADAVEFDAAAPEAPEAMRSDGVGASGITRRAAVQSGGSSSTASTFTIAGRVSIPTGDQQVRVCIMVEKLAMELKFTCTPKLDPLVYLSAVAKNTTPFELLAGPANIFYNQTFVCSTTLPDTPSAGGEVKIALGADESVKVKRQRLERRTGDVQRASLFSSAKRAVVHYAYLFEVTPEIAGSEIRVVDQYPLVTHKDMGVTLEEPELPKSKVGKDGVIVGHKVRNGVHVSVNDLHQVTWVVRDTPVHETQRFRLVFSVDYPEEKTPTGIDN